MTEPILSPAEEADAEALLAGLAEPVDQYAGLTPLEAAAAATSAHMSTCLRPSRLECVDCSEELHVFRAVIGAVRPGIEEYARHDERLKMEDELTQEIAKEILDLLAPGALIEWLGMHGLAADASPGATLSAYLCDLTGACSFCFGDQQPAPRHAGPEDGTGDDGAPVADGSEIDGGGRG